MASAWSHRTEPKSSRSCQERITSKARAKSRRFLPLCSLYVLFFNPPFWIPIHRISARVWISKNSRPAPTSYTIQSFQIYIVHLQDLAHLHNLTAGGTQTYFPCRPQYHTATKRLRWHSASPPEIQVAKQPLSSHTSASSPPSSTSRPRPAA